MAKSAKDSNGLSGKQALFVKEYLKDLNATQAALRAGYSEKTARFIGAENLTKPNIKAAIEIAINKRAERVELTADEVIEGIRQTIARCSQLKPLENADGSPVLVEGPNGDLVPAVKFDASNVLKGYELLGKHLKLFTDKVELGVDEDTASLILAARKRARQS